jgi:HK97 gp10 family phage protein
MRGFKVAGASKLRDRLKALPDELRDAMRVEVGRGLKATQASMRRNIKTVATMRTRTLWRNILFIQDLDGMGGTVGSFNEGYYGHFLEFGTRRGVKPRPWLVPAAREQRPKFIRRIRRQLGRIKKAGF